MQIFEEPKVLLVILALSGVVTGIINTIAGGGSFLTLPLLMALGLPPGIANGTNRVGILLQNVVSTATFHRRDIREYGVVRRLGPAMVVGAALGAYLATRLDDSLLRPLFGYVFLLWAVMMILRPGRFFHSKPQPHQFGSATTVSALAIGVYGGFMQAGVGFPLIGLLVLGIGMEPVRANSVKVLVTLFFTACALVIFAWAGDVAWREGAVLAAGTMAGGYLGTRWQIRSGATLVRWFVIVMMGVSGLMMVLR